MNSGQGGSGAPSSNFKRTNTVDTATIKENSSRYSGATPTRPATAAVGGKAMDRE